MLSRISQTSLPTTNPTPDASKQAGRQILISLSRAFIMVVGRLPIPGARTGFVARRVGQETLEQSVCFFSSRLDS